jgi:hypothetical protein
MIVGVLDLPYAILVYTPLTKHPILVPQTIASGILGEKSYTAGAVDRRLRSGVAFRDRPQRGNGLLFGRSQTSISGQPRRSRRPHLWCPGLLFMHIVVLPLSVMPKLDAPLVYQVTEFVEHWLCVGLPIAPSVRHYSR